MGFELSKLGIVRGRASQNGKRGGDVVSVWSRGSGSLPCVGVTVGPVPDHTQALQIPKLVNSLSQIGKEKRVPVEGETHLHLIFTCLIALGTTWERHESRLEG